MRNILNKMAIPVVALTLVSCDLDEYNPASLSGDEVLQTYDGIKGLESYCYSALYQEMFRAYDFLSVAEGGTDLWQVPGGSDYAMQPMYYDGLTTNTNATNKLFKQAYSMIGNCNSVINKASSVTDGTKSDLDILVAEAKCLRGYYYSVRSSLCGLSASRTNSPTRDSTSAYSCTCAGDKCSRMTCSLHTTRQEAETSQNTSTTGLLRIRRTTSRQPTPHRSWRTTQATTHCDMLKAPSSR